MLLNDDGPDAYHDPQEVSNLCMNAFVSGLIACLFIGLVTYLITFEWLQWFSLVAWCNIC